MYLSHITSLLLLMACPSIVFPLCHLIPFNIFTPFCLMQWHFTVNHFAYKETCMSMYSFHAWSHTNIYI